MNAPVTPRTSTCGLHEHQGPTCRPCAVLKAAVARELAETTPYYVTMRERAALTDDHEEDE